MQTRKHLTHLLVALAVALLACTPAVADIIDPTGDTFGVGSPQIDITRYNGDTGKVFGSVVFTMSFAGPIAPASAFAPNSVTGFIDIDTDRNPKTGATPFINQFGPPPPIKLGDEFFVDLGSEQFHPGLVDIVDANTNIPTGQAPITFGPNNLSITVPLSLLGNVNPLQPFNFGIIVGTFNEATDRAPNGAEPAQTVPEPGTIALFGLLLTGAGVVFRRRKAV
jgi:hypothetical protein